MGMVVISSILAVISLIVLSLSLKDRLIISRYEYVTGKLIQVDLAANSSSNVYEVTYRYKLNNATKIFISNRKYKNDKAFKETIRLYYKKNKMEVFELPTMEMIILSTISLVISSIATFVFIISL